MHKDKKPSYSKGVNISFLKNSAIQSFRRCENWCPSNLLISQTEIGKIEFYFAVSNRLFHGPRTSMLPGMIKRIAAKLTYGPGDPDLNKKIGWFYIVMSMSSFCQEMNCIDWWKKKLFNFSKGSTDRESECPINPTVFSSSVNPWLCLQSSGPFLCTPKDSYRIKEKR